jgi:ribokinase
MLLVFGSVNLDIAFHTEALPQAGQTVLGGDCRVSPGGKGANQAHAAQRDGMQTTFVGAVGTDAMTAQALELLERSGVDLSLVQRLPGRTGCAGIVVDARGENQIVVAPGVNRELRADHVPEATLARAGALLLQMETDPAQAAALAQRARRLGCPVILNNAPAHALDPEFLQSLDVLVVNEGELALTARGAGVAATDATGLVQALARRFALTAVLTLGSRGVAACAPASMPLYLPASRVDVLDTTGAGDTFCGVFTAGLVRKLPLKDALARAVVAAGLSCTRHGAQIAQPLREETDRALAGYSSLAGTDPAMHPGYSGSG